MKNKSYFKIGEVKIREKDLLRNKPIDPGFNNSTARPDCDCKECTDIIKHDAWFFFNDNDGISKDRLIKAVASQNAWEK